MSGSLNGKRVGKEQAIHIITRIAQAASSPMRSIGSIDNVVMGNQESAGDIDLLLLCPSDLTFDSFKDEFEVVVNQPFGFSGLYEGVQVDIMRVKDEAEWDWQCMYYNYPGVHQMLLMRAIAEYKGYVWSNHGLRSRQTEKIVTLAPSAVEKFLRVPTASYDALVSLLAEREKPADLAAIIKLFGEKRAERNV